MIVRMSILVIFAIRVVVFIVIGNEIVEIETVVSGYEVDRRPGFPISFVKQIAGAGYAFR